MPGLKTALAKLSLGLTVLSLLAFSPGARAVSISPSPSPDGSYNISWSYATGCHTSYYPPYTVTFCYRLEEASAGGSWSTVQTPQGATSLSVSGKPPGSYQYRVKLVSGSTEQIVEQAVSVQVGSEPLSVGPPEHAEYATRQGDLDGDGDLDIYAKRIAGTSWQLPVEEFILRQNANGTFHVDTSVTSAEMAVISQWGVSPTFPELVDFNADGFMDLLITGLDVAGVGPHDVVVFASDMAGAPPPSARLMDESIQRFLEDLSAYLLNPSYFNGVLQRRCSFGWTLGTGWQRDIDGAFYPVGLPTLQYYCWVEYDTNFDTTAFVIGPRLKTILNAGEAIAGSNEATVIANNLEWLLGTDYMGGSLQASATFLPIDLVDDLDNLSLEVRRAARVLEGILQMLQWMYGKQPFQDPLPAPPPTGPHSYTITNVICPITWEACTLENVFHRVRQFPVYGRSQSECGFTPRSQCAVEVTNASRTIVEPMTENVLPVDDVGPVRHVVDESTYTLQNITEEGHDFDPGTVTRRVFIENGVIKIETTGTGDGAYPEMNEIVGPFVFETIDAEISNRIETEQASGVVYP